VTEKTFGMTYPQIRNWADEYLKATTGVDYTKYRKDSIKKKTKRYYDKHIGSQKVELHCEFCQETHTVLKMSYDNNMERNGRYICEREGGKIAGSKPKTHLIKENPYEVEGKKECLDCKQILDFDKFTKDTSRRSGYKEICKDCNSKKRKAKYQSKKELTKQ
jgi:hypothetical protein